MLGQFIGTGSLVIVNIIAARVAAVVSHSWVNVLGLIPLGLGGYRVLSLLGRSPTLAGATPLLRILGSFQRTDNKAC